MCPTARLARAGTGARALLSQLLVCFCWRARTGKFWRALSFRERQAAAFVFQCAVRAVFHCSPESVGPVPSVACVRVEAFEWKVCLEFDAEHLPCRNEGNFVKHGSMQCSRVPRKL